MFRCARRNQPIWVISGPRSGCCIAGSSGNGALGSAGLARYRSILGQAQLQQFAGRHRIIATDHHDLAEQIFQTCCGIAFQGSLPAKDTTEEPSWPVHAHEAGSTEATAAVSSFSGQFGYQLRAESSGNLFGFSALARYRLINLFTDLVPKAFGTRCRKRLELQAGAVEVHGHSDHALGGFFHLKPQLETFSRCDQQCTEVNVAIAAFDLVYVKGPLPSRKSPGVPDPPDTESCASAPDSSTVPAVSDRSSLDFLPRPKSIGFSP